MTQWDQPQGDQPWEQTQRYEPQDLPPYGQQPPYGQPPYGQPPYGQPLHGQSYPPGYAAPAPGQPGYVAPAPGHPGYVAPAAGPGYPPPHGQGGYPGYEYGGLSGSGLGAALQKSESYGIAGTVLTLLGGILVLVALTSITWLKGVNGGTFRDVHDALKAAGGHAQGFAHAYFGWLAFVFLALVVVAGVLASVPTSALRIFRIIGVVVGLAAAGLTFLAIQLTDNGPSYLDYLKHARLGFYFAVIGFLLAGIGAAIGPRHV